MKPLAGLPSSEDLNGAGESAPKFTYMAVSMKPVSQPVHLSM